MCFIQQELYIIRTLVTLQSFDNRMKFIVVGFLILGLGSVKTETDQSDVSSGTKKGSKLLVSNPAIVETDF